MEIIGIDKDKSVPVNENDDTTLFEETTPATQPEKPVTENNASAEQTSTESATTEAAQETASETPAETPAEEAKDDAPAAKKDDKDDSASKSEKKEVIQSFDDNFIKKYKAKLKNRAQGGGGDKGAAPSYGGVAPEDGPLDNSMKDRSSGRGGADTEGDISELSKGRISERALTGDFKNYNNSLDFLDKNVKYTKYVIYVDPQNVNFIESLTVKERKNLINGILRQQDDISIAKLRFKVIQTIIRHVIITVLTVAISIPVIYYVINASLEATINNHRSAQTNWQTLYKEHGKITQN